MSTRRFKFCALIFGGEERRFDETECAFFLHNIKTINDPDRCFPLAPSDFARVNPNTCTAPVFRTRRDAEITRRIYERHPVLVDRSADGERRVWPVRYVRMFDMANDSHLFKTAAQLEAEGFYPVQGNRWKKGEELYLSLYEGKMVQAFDHRAASITNREGNLFRPGQPDRTLEGEHRDPSFSPRPRYWVSQQASDGHRGIRLVLGIQRHHGVNQRPHHDCCDSSASWMWTHSASPSTIRRAMGCRKHSVLPRQLQ